MQLAKVAKVIKVPKCKKNYKHSMKNFCVRKTKNRTITKKN